MPFTVYQIRSDLGDHYTTFYSAYLSVHFNHNTVEVVLLPLGTGVSERHQSMCYFHMRGSVLEGSGEAYCNRTL